MANYSFQDPDLPDGSVIDGGNFTQLLPNTEIMVGKTLTINGGNFTNVKRQPEWAVNGGNWTQIDRCTNLSPEWIGRQGYAACSANCRHVVSTDVVQVDGVTVETIYHYEDTVS